MVKLFYYVIISILIVSFPVLSQVKDSISQKNKELNLVKTEITKLEDELKTKTKKERESLQSLENLNKQKLLIGKLINSYKSDEEVKTAEILKTKFQM